MFVVFVFVVFVSVVVVVFVVMTFGGPSRSHAMITAVQAPEVQVSIGNCILVRFPSFATLANDPYATDAVAACYIEILVREVGALMTCFLLH